MRLARALSHIERSLVKNSHIIKARGLKAYLLRKLERTEEAAAWIQENLALDPFDFLSGNEQVLLAENAEAAELRITLNEKMRDFAENYLMTARDYAEFGGVEEAASLLNACTKEQPMLYYYEAYYRSCLGEDVSGLLRKAEETAPDYCFPNKLEDIGVLSFAIDHGCTAKAPYYLGCLFYDKLQWEESVKRCV